jgi:hypothetical protein
MFPVFRVVVLWLFLTVVYCGAQTPIEYQYYHIESVPGKQQIVIGPKNVLVGGIQDPHQVWQLIPGRDGRWIIRSRSTGLDLQLTSPTVDTPVTLGAYDPLQDWQLEAHPTDPHLFYLKNFAAGAYIGAEQPPNHRVWSQGTTHPTDQVWRFILEPKPADKSNEEATGTPQPTATPTATPDPTTTPQGTPVHPRGTPSPHKG